MPEAVRPAVVPPSVTLLSLLCLAAPAAGQELRWRSGEVLPRPSDRLAQQQPGELARRLAGVERHVLVRFERSPAARDVRLLRAAGVELGRALGGGAYFARVRPEALDARALERVGGLLDVREVRADWKLHPTLAAGETPSWTVVSRDPDPLVAVYLLLQEGVELEEGEQALAGLGGSVLDVLESVNGLVAFAPRSRVADLAADDRVAWVEPALPQMSDVSLPTAVGPVLAPAPNDSNRIITQANDVQGAPYNLDGSGVTVMVYDGGSGRASHDDFGGRLTVRDGSGTSFHATHVAGTIGGDGSTSGGTFRGMAPGVTIESYGFQWDGAGIFFFTNPGDFESDYSDAFNLRGAVLANNSIGTNVEPNGFNCPIQGDYGVMSSLIDGAVRGSLGPRMRIVWANGNERQGTRCDVESTPGYYSVAPPAGAKNHLTVGALNSNDDSMTGFSSWGPTDDGRLKPDVSAPGCQSGGDGGVSSTGSSSDTEYIVLCGTSMASPTACGLAALLIEDYRGQFGAPDPLGSTLKVLLAHTAFDRGNAGPDYLHGYGSLRIRDAIDFMRLGRFVEDELAETGGYVRWTVDVAPADPELRMTLAWDDAPAMPNVFGALVNDLDLVVRAPNGTRHHVWTLDPGSPANAAVQTQPDRVNNIEQVLVSAPMAGTWTVEVRGRDVAVGPQDFSLASSHALDATPHVRISFPGDLPGTLVPGASTTVTARVVGVGESVLGTPTLHVRYDGGGWLDLPMSSVGGDLYEADLPPGVCTAVPEFWFSADGTSSGANTHPHAAPAEVHGAVVASVSTVFADDFDADLGWSVTNTAITDGGWDRGVPSDGTRGAPLNAFGGAGSCYLTDSAPGNSDVDGGPTTLTSPLLDLSAPGDYDVTYQRWFTNDDYDVDSFVVQVSNDNGGSWTTVESLSNGGNGGGWTRHTFRVGDFVPGSSQVRVRFSVTDNPNDSVTEAALDAFTVERSTCSALPDCNLNGILDSDDIASARSLDVGMNGVPDECEGGPPVPTRGNNLGSFPTPPGPGGAAEVP